VGNFGSSFDGAQNFATFSYFKRSDERVRIDGFSNASRGLVRVCHKRGNASPVISCRILSVHEMINTALQRQRQHLLALYQNVVDLFAVDVQYVLL
jgi:hypothetical protein